MSDPKRMLFLSPSFFGYETDIREAIEAQGVVVDYFDERPTNSSLAKAVFRVGGPVSRALVASYYRRILRWIAGRNYDYVLIVKGEVVPQSFVETLRRRHPKAHFYYYSFDNIPEGSNPTRLFSLMDTIFSFDPKNVAEYPRMQLKPLFYSTEFGSARLASERTYDLSFVGTLHSDRYNFVTSLFGSFDRTHGFFYAPARWYFFLNKYVTRNFSGVAWNEVSFSKLAKRDVAAIFENSRAILDIQRTQQAGLTMRTFEVLASGAVLVTANRSILDAEFFDPNRIIVVDDYDEPGASDRLRAAINGLPESVGSLDGFEKHSIENWVRDFLRD